MISIPIKIIDKKISLPESIKQSFKKPVLFYLNPRDYAFFTTFCIIDFQNETLKYIITRSPEAIEIIKKYDKSLLIETSHSSLSTESPKGFFNFLGFNPYRKSSVFRYIDLEKNEMKIYKPSEDVHPLLGRISETSSLDNLNPGHFLIAFDRTDRPSSEIYRLSFDLKSRTKLIELDDHQYPPHHVISYKDYIITTEFFKHKIVMNNGLVFNDDMGLENYIYGEFYKKRPFIKKVLNKLKITELPRPKPYDLLALPEYQFSTPPGELLIFDRKNNYNLTRCPTGFIPSHIEINENNLYSSCHNFAMIKLIQIYRGPATINKFSLIDGKMIFEGKFEDPKGYRFTAHRFFKFNNHPYIITFGHPNRMFIIDATTMKLYKQKDIGEDILSRVDDVAKYLTESTELSKNDNPLRYSTAEPSEDGRYIMYWDQQNINFMDFESMNVELQLRFAIEGHFQKSYHSEKVW